ncbi:MAG: hypothetical protein R3F38_12085 [Gammaproteobacteria bacterium]
MRSIVLLFCLWLGLTSAQAATPSDTDIDALLQASGMQAQLDQIPAALQIAGQQQNGLGAGIVKPLADALRSVFNPADMEQIMTRELARDLDSATLTEAMRWFKTDAAKKILAGEQRMTDPSVMDRISEATDKQQVPGLTETRRQLLLDVDNATSATDAALDMMMNMQAAFLTALSHLLMPDQANEFSATLASFAATRDQYRDDLQAQLLLQQAILMEDVTDDELRQWRDFARTEAGSKTVKALNHALDVTLRSVAERIPAAMIREEQARQPAQRSAPAVPADTAD